MTQGYRERFSAIGRLYGEAAMPELHGSHFAVIGIGGVGSWTAEALARSGVGTLTLVDLDDICITNTNRQLHAISGTVGKQKVSVMADRLRSINPEIAVHEEIDFFTESTSDRLFSTRFDIVIDAIDSLKHKCFLIAECKKRNLPLIVCGGAGGKTDPTGVRRADLAFATNDRLLKLVRKKLRRDYDFPSEVSREPFGIASVFSVQNARYPWRDGTVREIPEPGTGLKLDCESGFGTATQVTGCFGFAAAAEAIRLRLNTNT